MLDEDLPELQPNHLCIVEFLQLKLKVDPKNLIFNEVCRAA